MTPESAQQQLHTWYLAHRRDFPWRANRDPYRIWISETMLQQTTTTAVIPFYERFLARFPDLKTLASAPLADVLEAWSGLGYYSRARNLHKASIALAQEKEFPSRFERLIEFSGFGPYTARAVASLAFGEKVGVVDGNVIRVLSRFHGRPWKWWASKERAEIQKHADVWVQNHPSEDMNQALMELGRTICTPKSPSCLLCPIAIRCQARRQGLTDRLPLARPRKERVQWHWRAAVQIKKGHLQIVKNETLPFLKGQWLLPGSGRAIAAPPKKFDFRHSIMHFDIFVTVEHNLSKISSEDSQWVPLKEIKRHVPTSLVHKALRAVDLHADSGHLHKPAAQRVGHSEHAQRSGRKNPRRRR